MIRIGEVVKDLALEGVNGVENGFEAYRGKWVVLYFYPKDNTPGCTLEAQDFRDALGQFEALNAVVIGISKDSLKSHEKFCEKQQLSFPLVSDSSGALHAAFDTWKLKKMMGREYMGTERSTFLIDPSGVLVEEWRKVSVTGHVEEVLEALKDQ